jgi:uncharacterized protein
MMKRFAGLLTIAIALIFAAPVFAADAKPHRVAFHVDQNDPAIMNLVLNNATNLMEYYHEKGEQVQIEIVAYGPGLHMLREDTSPVKDRLKHLASGTFPSSVKFSACGNTQKGMEKREGHAIPIVPEATIVPAGVVRLTELQEQGWSYIRP